MANSAEDAPMARGSLAGSEEALILPGAPRRASNSRALKVTGLVTLACLLLASQVFTAYMVYNQKQQIHSLQKNSERLGKRLTHSPKAVAPMRMHMPMNSFPLLRDFSEDDAKPAEKPKAKVQDTVVSVEKQVKDLMQDTKLPHFNQTFLANLLSLKQNMNESEWKSFESWMRYWLIFQMAQQNPAPPTAAPASLIKTKCQLEATRIGTIGSYKPQCDEQGHYKPMQCWSATGFCWCVDETGTTIEGTAIRGRPDCQRGVPFPRRGMMVPSLMQEISVVDDKGSK